MRKLAVCLACLAVVALVAALPGCGGKTKTEEKTGAKGDEGKAEPGKRLVGTWVGKPPEGEAPEGASITCEFKDDGKVTMTMSPPPMPMHGTWKTASEEGDKLAIDVTFEEPKEMVKEGAKPKTHSMKFLIEIKGADQMTMKPDDPKEKPVTFDRKKEK